VVRADDLDRVVLEEGDAAEHLRAEHGVRLHQAPLLVGERPGLAEHFVRDRDLADVVQQEAVLQRGLVGEHGVDRVRQLRRVALHAARVGAGTRVLPLQRARERRDGLGVGRLEQSALPALELDQMPQVAGVEQELLLVRACESRSEAEAGMPGRDPFDDREQLERPERLAQERVGARGSGDVLHVVEAREQHDADLAGGGVLLQAAAEGQAVHAGHVDVQHDHVGAAGRDPSRGLLGVGGFVHVDLDRLAGGAQQRTETFVVIDQQ
jgi:hypothetical protein